MDIKEVLCTDKTIKDNYDYYEKILRQIVKHEKFGSMNPVDIGVSCGFPEKDVITLVEKCYTDQSSKEDWYYFIINVKDVPYLIKFNRKTHELFTVKKLANFVKAKTRKNILAWSVNDSNKLRWENLQTGKKGDFAIRGVQDFSILEEGLLVICPYKNYDGWSEVIKYNFDGTEQHLRVISNYTAESSMVCHEDKIYIICSGRVWIIDENSEVKPPTKEKADFDCRKIGENKYLACVEFSDEDVYCYIHYEKSGKNIMYGIHSKIKKEVSSDLDMNVRLHNVFVPSVVTTQNYMLLGDSLIQRGSDNVEKLVLPNTVRSSFGKVEYPRLSQVEILESEDVLIGVLDKTVIISLELKKGIITSYYGISNGIGIEKRPTKSVIRDLIK